MGRVEAAIFASPAPVTRDALAKLVGRACNLDHLMSDIRDDLRRRPYELVSVVGGYAPPNVRGRFTQHPSWEELHRLADLIGQPRNLAPRYNFARQNRHNVRYRCRDLETGCGASASPL